MNIWLQLVPFCLISAIWLAVFGYGFYLLARLVPAPTAPGDSSVVYDLLASGSPADFTAGAGAECVEEDDGTDTQATDAAVPAPGSARHYLVRAENACPVGEGSLGADSLGGERVGRPCP